MVLVALYPLSSPNHNRFSSRESRYTVALYPLSSPNHNVLSYMQVLQPVALYPLSSPNHNGQVNAGRVNRLRYILFHHQTTTSCCHRASKCGCVISSFITKPQPPPCWYFLFCVALYPLSSPNHNYGAFKGLRGGLRYILFHHQTTTFIMGQYLVTSCVISSFITKPQRCWYRPLHCFVALYPLSSPNHNCLSLVFALMEVALYPLSSPNHNIAITHILLNLLRYILFHHQTTTYYPICRYYSQLRYILFHHQTTTGSWYSWWFCSLRYILFHHQTTTCDCS